MAGLYPPASHLQVDPPSSRTLHDPHTGVQVAVGGHVSSGVDQVLPKVSDVYRAVIGCEEREVRGQIKYTLNKGQLDPVGRKMFRKTE